jgi:hypothetical protein
MWCDKELEEKRKLRYYDDVINPNLEDKIIYVLALHSETRHWSIPKTPWDERVCPLCDTMKVEDKNNLLLYCPTYTQIKSQF